MNDSDQTNTGRALTSHLLSFENVNWSTQRMDIRRVIEIYFKAYEKKFTVTFSADGHASRTFSDFGYEINYPDLDEFILEQFGATDRLKIEIRFDVPLSYDEYPEPDDLVALRRTVARASLTAKEDLAHPFWRADGRPLHLEGMFSRQAVFLICNGPSFNQVDHTILRRPGILTFGLNNGARSFRTTFWTAVDEPIRFARSIWTDPCILKFVPISHFHKIWNCDGASPIEISNCPNIIGVQRNGFFRPASWLNEETVNWGNNGGGARSVLLCALKICCSLGFQYIYFLGCDFQMDSQHPYWFAMSDDRCYAKHNNRLFPILADYLSDLAPKLRRAGIQVYNTSPNSKLHVFPFCSLADAVKRHSLAEDLPLQAKQVTKRAESPLHPVYASMMERDDC